MKVCFISIHLILISFAFTFCDSPSNPNTKLSSLPLKNSDEKTVRLTDFEGKVVVLDFWATWCDPCSKAVPVLNQWKKSVSPEDFIFLGINTDESTELNKIREHIVNLKMEYPSLLDPEWKLAENYEVNGIPTLLVFNRRGELVYRQSGLRATDLPGLILRSRVWNQ